MEHFEHYLRPNPFVLYTDHRPLETLKKAHTRTFGRLQMMMEKFHFEIRYVPGKENSVADYLSRYTQKEGLRRAQILSVNQGLGSTSNNFWFFNYIFYYH